MEPVTHILTGACLSRTGLNRHAAYATLAMAVAAEFPDIDTLWSLGGPVVGFEHHRGITHTFLGVPFEAALIVAAIYGIHRWRQARAAHQQPSATPNRIDRPLTAAPVRWGLLYLFTLLALLSHLLLDFTNNYGIRPFFPFNSHWYAASIVFIFDPLIFALLLGALVVPAIFRLVGSEVASGSTTRRQPFAARGWAIAALLGIVGLWSFREVQHNHAIQLVMAQSIEAPQLVQQLALPLAPDAPAPSEPTPVYLQPQRALANPDPLSPFRWYTVADFGPLYQLGEVNSNLGTFTPNQATQPKLNPSPELLAAERTLLGRSFLNWSSMPFLTISHPTADSGTDTSGEPIPPGHTIVTFADPRFMGDTLLLHATSHTPLTGEVELDANNHVVRQSMDGKVQKR